MTDFKKGYKSFEDNSGAYGTIIADSYINSVNDEIDKLTSNINKFKDFKTDTNYLKGNLAEFWHSGTHNIDAAVKDVKIRTDVLESNGLGSVDIRSSDGTNYGLKYYSTGKSSALEQSKSYFERFMEYKKTSKDPQAQTMSFAEYLKKNDIDPNVVYEHDPIYQGQVRIIPKDQLEEAISFLKRKVNEESYKRPELAQKYQETLDNLTDKIKSSEGSESIPLSDQEAKELANIAKEGDFDPAEFGLNTEELIKFKYIMNQALKAGITSATITAVLKAAPKLFTLLENTIRNGEVNKDDVLNFGLASLQGGGEGFIRGSVSAALTTACLAGHLGTNLKNIDPSIIGAATVIVMNVVQNSIKLSQNKITKGEFTDLFFRDLFVSTCAIAAGGATQGFISIPIFGYMLGSFVGSMTASFVYDKWYKTYIGFCEETGFTFFGIVDQDYVLPKDILQSIGLKVFDYEKFNHAEFNYKKFEIKKFEYKKMELKTFEFQFIRRGVIGVNKIGYV